MSNPRILILGGRGRIGSRVAADVLTHTSAHITVTGRANQAVLPVHPQDHPRLQYLTLNLADRPNLIKAIAQADLVVHCAGPFRQRDTSVLETCIAQGVNYVDVSDDRVFTQASLRHADAARTAQITAVINTGVFPGISNSMVRQGIEQLDAAEEVHLRYVVAGSGGAGVTVMRTTFLGLQHAFDAWIDHHWQPIKPYTGRETIEFPPPFGKNNVYWFEMPESITLAQTFPLKTVTTKFGTVPDFYNRLTWLTTHAFPNVLMQQSWVVEGLAQISYRMTDISDRFSGIGVAMRVDIKGQKNQRSAHYTSSFFHNNTVVAAGIGTGSICQRLVTNQLNPPGVFSVEQILPTAVFEDLLASRSITLQKTLEVF
jgi:saccharopine dehydrogenase-like NADP-dependent oxidoreductase